MVRNRAKSHKRAFGSQGTSIGCAVPGGDSPSAAPHCTNPMNATNNNPYYRTMNLNATALSKEDTTRWNPWRAPGRAPLYDSCGMAGGAPSWRKTALSFYNTVHAKQGDLGSAVLPPNPTGVVWKAGETVETKWTIRANHGGGYQYRLCPLSHNLTEDCFRARPLPFAGYVALEWVNGSRTKSKAVTCLSGQFLLDRHGRATRSPTITQVSTPSSRRHVRRAQTRGRRTLACAVAVTWSTSRLWTTSWCRQRLPRGPTCCSCGMIVRKLRRYGLFARTSRSYRSECQP